MLRVGGGDLFVERAEGDEGLDPESEARFLGLRDGERLELPLSLFDERWTWTDPLDGECCADPVLPILMRLENVKRRDALVDWFAVGEWCDQKFTALVLPSRTSPGPSYDTSATLECRLCLVVVERSGEEE